jgi:hypothetical protein
MKQVGRALARLQGRDPGARPEATVSEHLRQPKVSAAMGPLLWEAIDECSPPPPPTQRATAGSEDLAEAVRLLTKCSQVQLAEIIGFIKGTLSR